MKDYIFLATPIRAFLLVLRFFLIFLWRTNILTCLSYSDCLLYNEEWTFETVIHLNV